VLNLGVFALSGIRPTCSQYPTRRTLPKRVECHGGIYNEASTRGDIQNPTASIGEIILSENPHRLPTDPDWTPEVHLKSVLGLLIGDPFNFPIKSIPNVVNDDVTTAEVVFGSLERGFDLAISNSTATTTSTRLRPGPEEVPVTSQTREVSEVDMLGTKLLPMLVLTEIACAAASQSK